MQQAVANPAPGGVSGGGGDGLGRKDAEEGPTCVGPGGRRGPPGLICFANRETLPDQPASPPKGLARNQPAVGVREEDPHLAHGQGGLCL